MDIEKEVLKGHVDTLLLSVLHQLDRYGYDISKEIKKISQNQFELKEGTMYLALKRLEKNNFIESYWNDDEPSASGGGRRKYYTITALGIKELERKKAEWKFMQNVMNLFLGGI